MKTYKFQAKISGSSSVMYPKGFYYQGRYVILVGDQEKGHTIRRKELINEVEIKIMDDDGKVL